MTTRAPAAAQRFADQHRVDRRVRFLARRRDDHAFARGEPVGLDDDRRAVRVDIGVRVVRVGKRRDTAPSEWRGAP